MLRSIPYSVSTTFLRLIALYSPKRASFALLLAVIANLSFSRVELILFRHSERRSLATHPALYDHMRTSFGASHVQNLFDVALIHRQTKEPYLDKFSILMHR
jgi:hypothetical protein